MSAYTDFTIERFGGLNLAADPEEVGADGAVDLLNVRFDREGRVRSRDGTATFCTLPAPSLGTAQSAWMVKEHLTSASAVQVIAAVVTTVGQYTLQAFNSSGTALNRLEGLTALPRSPVQIGTPAGTFSYVAVPDGTPTLAKWDGTNWSRAGGVAGFAPLALGVTPWDNRLVVAGGSRVYFSDPGAPETMGVNNYVDLHPGDGDAITGIVPWREFLIVFKSRRFYVFYGTSLASDGVTPVFNYRTVETGGVGAVNGYAVTAARDGVYFVSSRGVYRTAGGAPEYVSPELEPLFLAGQVPFFTYGTLPAGASNVVGMTSVNDAVAIRANDGTNFFLLWLENGRWSVFSLPSDGTAIGKARIGAAVGAEDLLFGGGLTTGTIRRMNGAYTNDAGTAIASRYRTGFYDMGIDEEKTIRETTLAGQGTVGVSMSRDFGSLGTATNATLGTAPATARKHVRIAQPGDTFSTQLASVSGGAWQVNRLTHHVREQRQPGAKTT